MNEKSFRDEAAALIHQHLDSSMWSWTGVADAVIALVRERDAALTPGCFWEQDGEMWTSSCGANYQFTDGGPAENDHQYCHLCGCPIEIAVDVIAQDEPA